MEGEGIAILAIKDQLLDFAAGMRQVMTFLCDNYHDSETAPATLPRKI
jgi:hypothetical protein